jgi:ADP-L-glycero-D-manno-heptose 6-epimerase
MEDQFMKTLIITGAAGFIGFRFCEWAQKNNIPYIAVDAMDHFKSRTREHVGLNPKAIWEREHLIQTLRESQETFGGIIHLGACTDTTEMDVNYLNKINVEYSKNLWKFCTEKKIPFVYASSAATYGEGELGYLDDETLIPKLKPLNPYGESKREFDEWLLAEEKSGNTPPSWAGFKFFNVYGFGEGHKGKMASVVYHSFHQIQKTGGAKLFMSHKEGISHGEQKRDFIWVDDVVQVLAFALTHPIPRGIFNLGTGKARTFLDLVNAVFKALQLNPKIEFIPTPESLRERYQYFTEGPMEKLRAAGYLAPFHSLEDGVKETLERLRKLS